MQPDTLRYKVLEPVLLLGKQRFANVDIRIRVKGGGHVSQIFAIRQAVAKALVAFYQKCEWPLLEGRGGVRCWHCLLRACTRCGGAGLVGVPWRALRKGLAVWSWRAAGGPAAAQLAFQTSSGLLFLAPGTC